jgi:hypothetical protein
VISAYSYCSPSHSKLAEDWLRRYLPDDVGLILVEGAQECPTGEFKSAGWIAAMRSKVRVIIRAIEETWEDAFLFVDADIQFFGPVEHVLRSALRDVDLVAQDDTPVGRPSGKMLCAGLFACNSNDRTRRLWTSVLDAMENPPYPNDQQGMNNEIRRLGLAAKPLPIDLFWSRRKRWRPGDEIAPPHGILAHHANYTKGVEAKAKQLSMVRQLVEIR